VERVHRVVNIRETTGQEEGEGMDRIVGHIQDLGHGLVTIEINPEIEKNL
jgi:hypothetical protein